MVRALTTAVIAALAAAALAAPAPAAEFKQLLARTTAAQIPATGRNGTDASGWHAQGTEPGGPAPFSSVKPKSTIPLKLVNNKGGNVYAYVVATDGDGHAYILKQDGTPYYPAPTSGTPSNVDSSAYIKLGSGTTTVNLGEYMQSGRIYMSTSPMTLTSNLQGSKVYINGPGIGNPSDPNNDILYGFAEVNYAPGANGQPDNMYSNLSYVDELGLPISMQIESSQDSACLIRGISSDGLSQVCKALESQQSTDGKPWGGLCSKDGSGNYVRAISPNQGNIGPVNGQFDGYYEPYVSQVFDHFTSTPLTVKLNSGSYSATVQNGELVFNNGGGSWAKPSTQDIFSCEGALANTGASPHDQIGPVLCAAFTHSTLLQSGGNNQIDGVPQAQYYTTSPTSHWCRIIHANEVDGRGVRLPRSSYPVSTSLTCRSTASPTTSRSLPVALTPGTPPPAARARSRALLTSVPAVSATTRTPPSSPSTPAATLLRGAQQGSRARRARRARRAQHRTGKEGGWASSRIAWSLGRVGQALDTLATWASGGTVRPGVAWDGHGHAWDSYQGPLCKGTKFLDPNPRASLVAV